MTRKSPYDASIPMPRRGRADGDELDRLRRELAETEQKRIDEWLVSEVLRRELAEVRELLAEWCSTHSLDARGTLFMRSKAAMAEPKEVPRG